MTLIKTSLLSGIAVVIRTLTLLCLNKLLAVYVGPGGYAVIGQFQNAVQMISTLASGATNTGVTKYTAEYFEDPVRQRIVWRNAGTIAICCSGIAATILVLFSDFFALELLNDSQYAGVFIWLAVSLVFFVLNLLLIAILNGKKEIQKYVLANITGSIVALVVTGILAYHYGLYGALVALAINQSVAFVVTAVLVTRSEWFKWSYLFGRIDPAVLKNLFKYTAMAMTTAICVPVSHIMIRSHIGENLGWEAAGYWEAMWRLSAAYLMMITMTLSVYYLPRLSELSVAREIWAEISQGYRIILPVAALLGFTIYLMRDVVIVILFSDEFLPMRDLFALQMIGDTLKIGSWILSYLMLGKAMFKLFIATEVTFAAGFVMLSVWYVDLLGLEGAAWAHATTYLLYWLVLAVYMVKIHRWEETDAADA